ncbi:hypothetical protein SDC9_100963 [bioreactor metagenome]|uniref:Uncharacterized protein n=1 Tax=bioreactor metagenome TaxID=1076179 RepID=A0A645AM09_9ZZZZ
MNSGYVIAPRFSPMRLVGGPKITKAIKIPKKMFRKVSHKIPIPKEPAIPPNPMIAEVLIKAAP